MPTMRTEVVTETFTQEDNVTDPYVASWQYHWRSSGRSEGALDNMTRELKRFAAHLGTPLDTATRADCEGFIAERVSVLPDQQIHMDVVDFKKAFGVLSDDQKEVLLLVGAEGFSYEEAAEITGAAVGTVKSRVNRARSALTKALGLEASENFTSNSDFVGLVRSGQSAVRG